MLYIDCEFHPIEHDPETGEQFARAVWLLGEAVVKSDTGYEMLSYPRITCCPCLRRVISHAKIRYPGVMIRMGDVALEVLKHEDWKHEGWENPALMMQYVQQVGCYQ